VSIQLKGRNIVLAGAFNTPSFDKYFFIKNNIIRESDLTPNSFRTDLNISQIVAKSFNILITPPQIVINLINETDAGKLEDIASKIIEAGDIIQLNAIGFNFNWNFVDSVKNVTELSKEYFYNDKIQTLNSYFNKPDSKYGFYASTNFENARLKLDVKPTSNTRISSTGVEKSETIQFLFNFHFDMPKESKAIEAINYIKEYGKYKNHSSEIMDKYK